MREIHARLTDADLERFRVVETEYNILQSGSVSLSMEAATRIVEAHRHFWIYAWSEYGLELEEFYEIDSVTGAISVDKE